VPVQVTHWQARRCDVRLRKPKCDNFNLKLPVTRNNLKARVPKLNPGPGGRSPPAARRPGSPVDSDSEHRQELEI
jgi:hypothetical protein